jgi:hypothetical protein
MIDTVALDGSPAQVFASHKARVNGIARFFTPTHPLVPSTGRPRKTTRSRCAHICMPRLMSQTSKLVTRSVSITFPQSLGRAPAMIRQLFFRGG